MGDDLDFDCVLAEFGPALQRLAGSYENDPGRRDDLAQEIAIALWRGLPRFRGSVLCGRSFIGRAQSCPDTRGRRGRAPTGDMAEAEQVIDPAESAESRVARGQRRERLDAAIRSLPIVHRQVLTLALEDLSHTEIAGVLGIRENAVAVCLTRARQALREALGVSS